MYRNSFVAGYSIRYYTILYYTILYYTILYYTILYFTLLYYAMLFYTVLYYTILYYTVLYCTVLYSAILYYIKLQDNMPHPTVVCQNVVFHNLCVFYCVLPPDVVCIISSYVHMCSLLDKAKKTSEATALPSSPTCAAGVALAAGGSGKCPGSCRCQPSIADQPVAACANQRRWHDLKLSLLTYPSSQPHIKRLQE